MKWSKNNRACKTLWSTLRILNEISRRQTFKTTGDLTVGDLTSSSLIASGNMGRLRAEALAAQLDNVFREIRGAAYEEGFKRGKALTAMTKVLADPARTVADLGNVVDDIYEFRGEDA